MFAFLMKIKNNGKKKIVLSFREKDGKMVEKMRWEELP